MKPSALLAGAAQVDITPPMGVEMCGYGWYEKRLCTEILDRLQARALWLEVGEQAVAILAVDLCTIDLATHAAVARQLEAACGLRSEKLMICASHTHSGPATQYMIAWGERDPGYMARLPAALAEAVLQARTAAVPARCGACRTRISDVGVNREQPALAPLDTAAQLLRVDREDGAPVAVLYNFGAHGVARYPFTSRISADWPGLVAACIADEMGGVPALFLQGPCGNINAHDMTFERRAPEIRQQVCDARAGEVARRFSAQILPALKTLKTSPPAELRTLWKSIPLPCLPTDCAEMERLVRDHQALADGMTLAQLRPLHERMSSETGAERAWREARWNVDRARRQMDLLTRQPPQVREAVIQVIKLGDAVLVGWPAEVFVELGLELRQRSPFPLTFVSSFTNDTVGYIPTAAAYESKGKGNDFGRYPRDFTHFIYGHLPFRDDVGRILVEESMGMLNALAAGGK